MTTDTASWFIVRTPRPAAPVRLLCVPYAGGGPAAYAGWPAALGADVEVCAVALPGRERRAAEEPSCDPVEIARAVAAFADRPYALFGHSMGALVAFEVVRELRRTGGPLPVHLFVSGCPAPDTPRRGDLFEGLSQVGDTELLDRLVRGGGLPAEVTTHPELLELLLPVFRADFGWLDAYQFTDEPALPVPVTAFAGTGDSSAQPAEVEPWQDHTTAGFELRVLPGGHFFPDEDLAAIARPIRAALFPPAS